MVVLAGSPERFGPSGVVPPGTYLYAGSAYGPGGLRARLERHLRPDKRPRWHIDALTAGHGVLGACVYVGGDECALARALALRCAPVPGFGSSDCGCPSHLYAAEAPWEAVPAGGVRLEPEAFAGCVAAVAVDDGGGPALAIRAGRTLSASRASSLEEAAAVLRVALPVAVSIVRVGGERSERLGWGLAQELSEAGLGPLSLRGAAPPAPDLGVLTAAGWRVAVPEGDELLRCASSAALALRPGLGTPWRIGALGTRASAACRPP